MHKRIYCALGSRVRALPAVAIVPALARRRLGARRKEDPMAAETRKALKAHIAIHVQDVAKSIEFYRNLFGIEPSKVRTGYAKFDVANPPLNFTLNEGKVRGTRHSIASGNSSCIHRRRAGGAPAMARERIAHPR